MGMGSRICAAVLVLAIGAAKAYASATCPDEQTTRQVPTNLAQCAMLERDVRRPGAFALNVYEEKLNAFLGGMCHRNEKAGWVRDKGVRDTGPWVGTYAGGQWSGRYFGTHAPVRHLVLAGHARVAAREPARRKARAEEPCPRSRRRDDGQGDVPAARCGVRRDRSDCGSSRSRTARRSWCAIIRRRMTAGSGAGTASARTRAGRRTGPPRRRAPIPIWASASTAPTATPRRAITRPSPTSRTSRANRAFRSCS